MPAPWWLPWRAWPVVLAWGCVPEADSLPPRPQIVVSARWLNFCEVRLGLVATAELVIRNEGHDPLEIDQVEVHHDRRCSFAAPGAGFVRLHDEDESDTLAARLDSLESRVLRLAYQPQEVDEDAINVVLHSNAENEPTLTVRVCGAGKAADDASPSSCAIRTHPDCVASGVSCSSQASCGDATCQEADGCVSAQVCALAASQSVDEENRPERGIEGRCECRPCAVPPDDAWTDCATAAP